MNYWEEVVSEALEVAKVEANAEQIKEVARWVESAHSCYGAAHGHERIPDPVKMELEKVKAQLETELNKVTCHTCHGRGGWTVQVGNNHVSPETCYTCNGKGKV